jgi:hypothetical protein
MSETNTSHDQAVSDKSRSESAKVVHDAHAPKSAPTVTPTDGNNYRDRPADDGARRQTSQDSTDTPSRR